MTKRPVSAERMVIIMPQSTYTPDLFLDSTLQNPIGNSPTVKNVTLEKNLFRHELKYLISLSEKDLLVTGLKGLMKRDTNANGGKYKIRSLYFDDYFHSAYEDKMQGYYNRKKYRIRFYDDDDRFIRLECKLKKDSYICKKSTVLTREETEWILDGNFHFLLKKSDPLCHEFYYQCTSCFMRPCVIVDYEREPFIHTAGDVRITFDTDVRSAMLTNDFFRSDLACNYVMEAGKAILEVKFTEFLPKLVRDALHLHASELTAFSKFTACFEATTAFYAFNG